MVSRIYSGKSEHENNPLLLRTVCSRECCAGPILEQPIDTFGAQQP